jgi:hypothetical protein
MMGLNSDMELFRVYTAAAASRNDGIKFRLEIV